MGKTAVLTPFPDIINADFMTITEFHKKLKKDYDDIEAGKV